MGAHSNHRRIIGAAYAPRETRAETLSDYSELFFESGITTRMVFHRNAGDTNMVATRLVSRNIVIGRRRTSMRLEAEMWSAISEICARELMAIGDLIDRACKSGDAAGPAMAVRNFVLAYFRAAANESKCTGSSSSRSGPHAPDHNATVH